MVLASRGQRPSSQPDDELLAFVLSFSCFNVNPRLFWLAPLVRTSGDEAQHIKIPDHLQLPHVRRNLADFLTYV